MLLKRIYAETAGDSGTAAPVVSHVQIMHTGLQAAQNFSDRLVEQAVVDGWAVLYENKLVLKGDPEDLEYTVQRSPGYYCVSSGERIPISEMAWRRMKITGVGDLSQREAAAWLLTRGKAANDYEVCNAYECVLAEEQHAKFKLEG